VALPLREHTRLEDSTIEIIFDSNCSRSGSRDMNITPPSQLSGGMKKRAAVVAR